MGPPFPFSTGYLVNTNGCLQNYKTACTQGCYGDILTFTSCGGDRSQDTYLRLFLGEEMVAVSDDYCNAASLIQYTVNSTGCEQYCIHMGCFGLAQCIQNVTATRLSSLTVEPTLEPTELPTMHPTLYPTTFPTMQPVGGRPTSMPSSAPSGAPTGQSVQLYVNNLIDSNITSTTYCTSNATGMQLCNLRSAWKTCETFSSNSKCIINLPFNTTIPMENIDYGALILSDTSNIELYGQNSRITGELGTAPEAVSVGAPFPYYTGQLMNTQSDSQNYSTACTQACYGNTLTFSGCNADVTQDTYFKLYVGAEMVAENDDACGEFIFSRSL